MHCDYHLVEEGIRPRRSIRCSVDHERATTRGGHRKSAMDEEFDMLQRIQEERMAFSASMACHKRCVNHYWFNNFHWNEKACMQNCLEKMNQATIITNINFSKFEEMERKK